VVSPSPLLTTQKYTIASLVRTSSKPQEEWVELPKSWQVLAVAESSAAGWILSKLMNVSTPPDEYNAVIDGREEFTGKVALYLLVAPLATMSPGVSPNGIAVKPSGPGGGGGGVGSSFLPQSFNKERSPNKLPVLVDKGLFQWPCIVTLQTTTTASITNRNDLRKNVSLPSAMTWLRFTWDTTPSSNPAGTGFTILLEMICVLGEQYSSRALKKNEKRKWKCCLWCWSSATNGNAWVRTLQASQKLDQLRVETLRAPSGCSKATATANDELLYWFSWSFDTNEKRSH